MILGNITQQSQGGVISTPQPLGGIEGWVQWSQSNLDGRVDLSNLPVEFVNPTDKIKYYEGGQLNDFDSTTPPLCMVAHNNYASDLLYGQLMHDYLGKALLVTKDSAGGSSLKQTDTANGDWNVDIDSINSELDHLADFLSKITNTYNYCRRSEKLLYQPKFIWSDIGETDSIISNKAEFKTNYIDTSNRIREVVGNIPIVHRELGLYQSGVTQWMIDAVNEFANGDIEDFHLISNVGLSVFDGLHLDAPSQVAYANRVFELTKDWFTKAGTTA